MVRCPQSQRFRHASLLQIAKHHNDFAMLKNIRFARLSSDKRNLSSNKGKEEAGIGRAATSDVAGSNA